MPRGPCTPGAVARQALALERLPAFAALRRAHPGPPAIAFLVKLGFVTPSSSVEHPWFEVHDLDDDHVDATCINQPHDLPDLHEGHRSRHPLSAVTDFAVLGPWGQAGPDELPAVIAALAAAAHAD